MNSDDIENLLRERLGAGSSLSQPSPGFEDRVRRSLTPRGAGSRRWSRALQGVVGLAAVLALAAVAVPWVTGPRAGMGPGGSGDDAASPSATPEPTLAPTASPTPVPVAHAQKWFLSFDYPADWTVTDRDITAATAGLNAGSTAQGEPCRLRLRRQ